ncbi:MAG: hypothetical protein LC799_01965 [Actinobacteria bacterium]|nr:hypothetical protein [Actinomycetota bacterium]
MINTRTLTYAAATLLCSTAISAAQSGAMDEKNMMGHPVTVTGCVAAGTMAGDFMLTRAVPVDSKMIDKDTVAQDNGRTMPMEKDKMAGEHMMSFLGGGTDLKAHLGHKIEVKGTTDKPVSDMKPMTGMDDKPMALTVTSVTMISATCPQ